MSYRFAIIRVLGEMYRPAHNASGITGALELIARYSLIPIAAIVSGFLQNQIPEVKELHDWVVPLFTSVGVFALLAIYATARVIKNTAPPLSAEDVRQRMALEGDVVQTVYPPHEFYTEMPYTQFTTEGDLSRRIPLHYKPKALGFVMHGQVIVREAELPVTVQLDRGSLVVKEFQTNGFLIEERGVPGDRVRVELYLDVKGRPWAENGRVAVHADVDKNPELSGRILSR